MRAHPSGGLLVAAPSAGVFTTTDGARTYKRVGVPGVPVIDLTIVEKRPVRWLIAGTKLRHLPRPAPGRGSRNGA